VVRETYKQKKNKIHLTPRGLADLKQEFDRLKEEKRPRLVERLSVARSQGDLSENQEYIHAREELSMMDGRIIELKEVIDNAIVIKKDDHSEAITLGSKVTVELNSKELAYHLVGEWEADPKSKKISHKSPLGQKLMGKKSGEMVEIEAPAGKMVYKIVRIE